MNRILLLVAAFTVLSISTLFAAPLPTDSEENSAVITTPVPLSQHLNPQGQALGKSQQQQQAPQERPQGLLQQEQQPGQQAEQEQGQQEQNQQEQNQQEQDRLKTASEAPAELKQKGALKGGQTVELSPVERAMGESPVTALKAKPQQSDKAGLTQFGYSFFRPDASGFAPQTDVPVGPDYIVSAGDRLVLTVWGSIDGTFNLEVNRAGEVVLPKVGPVKVAGQRFDQLQVLVKQTLARVYRDFHLNVAMGKLRLIKVYVVGEVRRPGDYNLTSLSTLINALSAAGGPTKNGSLRKIQINRNGTLVETVDLYEFFLKGDKGRDIRLQPGDTILVPVIGSVAGVAGNVRRPAIYELKNERTLNDLLLLAGGVTSNGYLQRVQLYRVQAHEKKVVTDFSLDPSGGNTQDQPAGAISLQDFDLVKVLPIDNVLRGYVRLDGYVLRPGDYALKPGMRVSALLSTENLLPEYYRGAGKITRLYPPDLHPEVIVFDVSRALTGDPAYDLELKEFDSVRIFARKEMQEIPFVKVNGEVQKPGQSRFYENMTVRDLIMEGGGLKYTAYLKNAEITRLRRSGESVSSYPIRIDLADALAGGTGNIKLEPFDELTVRRIPNWAEDAERYVTLKGEFVFPGSYPIYKGERLSAVIERAGGFTDKAFLRGAKFTRVRVRELQQKRMDEILARTEVDLAQKESELVAASLSQETQEATKASLEGLKKTAELLKKTKAEGRVVIRLSSLREFRGGPYDLEVQGGDVIEVPSDPKVVSVFGQVYNPASFVYLPGDKVRHYLKRSGGTTREAEEGDIYLIKADGSVESRQAAGPGFLGMGGFLSKEVESGDTLVVPQRLEKVAWLRELKDIAIIFGQLALAAGVVVAAGL